MTSVGSDLTVDGMADAIEARRKQLGLSPGQFAAAASLTRQGAGNVRRGLRREYQDDTINGVANALRWGRDWYQRLQEGLVPTEVDEPEADIDEIRRLRAELADLRARLDRLERQGSDSGGPRSDGGSP